ELRSDEVGFAFQRRGSGHSNGSVREAVRYLRHVVRLRRRMVRAGLHCTASDPMVSASPQGT
ncbi:MAG: hypothetical protein KY464_07760, partial [Gemmatimonadetes bacterium]|nr:hypothetical protein [Gemmatimonadota bacterium]